MGVEMGVSGLAEGVWWSIKSPGRWVVRCRGVVVRTREQGGECWCWVHVASLYVLTLCSPVQFPLYFRCPSSTAFSLSVELML